MDQLGPRAVLCAHGDRAASLGGRAGRGGIDTAGLQRVVNADPASGLVTIEGAAKLHALGPQLANLEKLST